MTTRVLPVDEWPKLDATSARDLWRTFDEHVLVLVVEQDGQIIGSLVLMDVIHAECWELAPEARGKAAVARALWTALSVEVAARGGQAVWASAADDRMRTLLDQHAAPVPTAQHYILPILPEDTCRHS